MRLISVIEISSGSVSDVRSAIFILVSLTVQGNN
jgi:hypothetical protein